jgi:serine phosphatase RsbU (regulator of sigma subunit)
MTYRTARAIVQAGTMGIAALAFMVVPLVAVAGLSFLPAVAVGSAVFIALHALRDMATATLERRAFDRCFRGRETRVITDFTERVGVCFTVLDLVEAMRDRLERSADMGVILVKSASWEVVYRSPSTAAADPQILEALGARFRAPSSESAGDAPEGVSFFADDLSPAKGRRGGRGFLVRTGGYHLFVLTRLCAFVEPEAFETLHGELRILFDRVQTVSRLFEVESLSKEWQLIAETQRSFLPRRLPSPKKLDLAVHYTPLINVSGDYYDAIPVDDDRTLIVAGDVSGKGLAAGLIMGIIVNTIRVAADKSDLTSLVRNVDAAIRDMDFDDKYTVMFIGLVDTARRTLRYVNAAMADPIIVTRSATGPQVARLGPSMGIIGLLPFGEVKVEELPLSDDEIILLASDGVTEMTDASGARLGETEPFGKALALASTSGASDFVSAVAGILRSFVGDRPLEDDVTIFAAKVGKLWD